MGGIAQLRDIKKTTYTVKIPAIIRNFADENKKILTDINICRINIKKRRSMCHKNTYFYAFSDKVYKSVKFRTED